MLFPNFGANRLAPVLHRIMHMGKTGMTVKHFPHLPY